ncbi:MAG: hypothetical protein ACXWLH_01055 [Candidatus Saccharimonadales bacterium]
MKTKQKLNVMQFFYFSLLIAACLFLIDIPVSNRVNNNSAKIISSAIFGLFELVPFIFGAVRSLKLKNKPGAALNLLLMIIITIWTVWICLFLYGFKDFQLIFNV